MAQRRSKNRRSSIRSNASGFFNENTDIIDNGDPLWFDRTVVRPSTSFVLTKRISSVLNSDSTINGSQISDGWFKNLTQSETSQLMEEVIRKNISNCLDSEQRNSYIEDLHVESNSDQEFRKKRSKFRLNIKKQNKTDNSNAFLDILQKTTDSTTKKLTNIQISPEDKSESSNDDSKTIKKLRPNIFKIKKCLKNDTTNFDGAFYSDSITEKNHIVQKVIEFPPKRVNNNSQHLIPEIIKNSVSKNINTDSTSDINNKIIAESRKKLYSNDTGAMNSAIKTQPRSGSVDTKLVSNNVINFTNSLSESFPKNRPTLFSQGDKKSKSETNQNLFDAVFQGHSELDSDNEISTIESNKSTINQRQINESKSSSTSKNVRTKTLMHVEEKNGNESEHESRITLQKRNNNDLSESQSTHNNIMYSITTIPLMQKSNDTLRDSANDTQVEISSASPKNSPKNSSKKRKRLLKRKKVSLEKTIDKNPNIQVLKLKTITQTDNVSKIKTKASIKKLSKIDNNSKSLSLMNKSKKEQTINVSLLNESVMHKKSEVNNKEFLSENENSSLPKYIRRTRSQTFYNTKLTDSNVNNSTIFNFVNISKNNPIQKSNDAEKLTNNNTNRSQNSKKSNSNLRKVVNVQEDNFFKIPQVSMQRLSNKITSYFSLTEIEKENRSNSSIEELKKCGNGNFTKKTNRLSEKLHVFNSTMSISENRENSINLSTKNKFKIKGNQKQSIGPYLRKSTSMDDLGEDSIHTPHPAQSTLNPSGKPFTRITQFSYINSDINETSSSQNISDQLLPNINNASKEDKSTETTDTKANAEMDRINNFPLEIRQQNENFGKNLLSEREKLRNLNIRSLNFEKIKNISMIKESEWVEVQRKIDLIKEATLAHLKQEKENQKKLEYKKARTELKFMHSMALKKTELHKKQKKPIDKAFYLDGKLYKQPKLPRPKNWVNDRLYKHLWNCMQNKFGLRTRIESEKFIKKLSDISTVIIRRKKYENYVAELNDLLNDMAKLKIIKNRYDFYRFCSEFMPYSFRIKVVPMKLPGNIQNIPYNPKLVNEPILEESTDFEE